eukprot:5757624-Amphidinium_carterae.1
MVRELVREGGSGRRPGGGGDDDDDGDDNDGFPIGGGHRRNQPLGGWNAETMHGHATEGRISLRPLPAEGMTLDSLKKNAKDILPHAVRDSTPPHRPGNGYGSGGGGPNDPNDPFGIPGGRDSKTTTTAVLLDLYPDFLEMVEVAVEETTETTLEVETILENLTVPGADMCRKCESIEIAKPFRSLKLSSSTSLFQRPRCSRRS